MDSLSQIVLGAAVGEAVLGRKVGNRAILWGGIAGTVPDLDVFANSATDVISALAYHRAFTHSLVFGVLAPLFLAPVVHRLYGGRSGPGYRLPRVLEYGLYALGFFLVLLVGSHLMPIEVLRVPQISASITGAVAVIILVFGLRQRLRRTPSTNGNASIRDWYALFLMSIITHPLLDCFTSYGTQILQPIHEHRATWNTISVADPIYTFPFLLFLVLAGRQFKGSRRRRLLNGAGLVVSSAYLLLTVVNHFNVRSVMDATLAAADSDIPANRYVIQPSILNNVLWQGTVQGSEDDYYFSRYSILDEERRFDAFRPLSGNHQLLARYQDTRELRTLNWFTKGYIGYLPRGEGKVQVNDLRYGLLGEDPADPKQYIFHWVIDTTTTPLTIIQEAGPSEDVDMGAMMVNLWNRLKGR